MKAVIQEKETKSKYPYLAQSTNCCGKKNVVLFKSKESGTVVYSEDLNLWPLGDFVTSWGEEDAFTPFTGSITLSND